MAACGCFKSTPRLGPAMARTPPLAALLQDALSGTFALYAETHLAHWNVVGPAFPQLHRLFEEQYTELWTALDVLAERLRGLGTTVDPEMFAAAAIDPASSDARTLVGRLAKGHRALSAQLFKLQRGASQAGDPATADLAAQRIHAHDKHAWMLESTLQGWA